ncbi:hypothetical protein M3Y99_00720800 [Aphelenchoides fujianensis]|nr:hypothetical protein M3Y99_00720800 [Aphelenchoides fujianensis]
MNGLVFFNVLLFCVPSIVGKIYKTQYLAMTQRMNAGGRIYDPQRFNCHPYWPQGCGCLVEEERVLTLQTFDSNAKCRGLATSKIVADHVEVDWELRGKLDEMRPHCLPRPPTGCRCTERRKDGRSVRRIFHHDHECWRTPENSTMNS